MHEFEYHEPKTLEEASSLLLTYGDEARLLAGGTDLLVKFRKGVLKPQHILDVKKIPGLRRIELSEAGVEIGAAATMYETEQFLAIHPQYRVLSQAVHSVASCQIRSRATIAGNVCNSSPVADTSPALVVLGASLRIFGPRGERVVPVEKFFSGPGQNVLLDGEIVTATILPRVPALSRGTYLKQSRRRMVDLATVSLAAFTDGTHVRIALGAVAPTVVRALAAEKLLAEQGLDRKTALEAAKLVPMSAAPITDIRSSREYRLELVGVLAERALLELCGGGQS